MYSTYIQTYILQTHRPTLRLFSDLHMYICMYVCCCITLSLLFHCIILCQLTLQLHVLHVLSRSRCCSYVHTYIRMLWTANTCVHGLCVYALFESGLVILMTLTPWVLCLSGRRRSPSSVAHLLLSISLLASGAGWCGFFIDQPVPYKEHPSHQEILA